MTNPRRYVTASLILVSVLALAGCSGGADGVMKAGSGQIRIVMSSGAGSLAASPGGVVPVAKVSTAGGSRLEAAPSPSCDRPDLSLQAANVTLSSILARTIDGKLIDVTIDLPVTLDLLSLGGGNEVTLPIGFLPPGTYDQIVVVMTAVEFVLTDGTRVAVTPPGGGWTAIVEVGQPFTVVEGETTTVTIEFRKDLSFGCGDGGWAFNPQFDCESHDGDDRDGDHDD